MDSKLKAKMDEQAAMTGARRPNPVKCRTCKFSHGKAPWENGPEKANCAIFAYGTELKPKDILFEGADCDFYVEEKQ